VNGKVRDRLELPVDLPEDEVVEHALASPRVQALLDGGEVRRTVVVPQKLVNVVIA
jgi:leucyl-tRNA synthetase